MGAVQVGGRMYLKVWLMCRYGMLAWSYIPVAIAGYWAYVSQPLLSISLPSKAGFMLAANLEVTDVSLPWPVLVFPPDPLYVFRWSHPFAWSVQGYALNESNAAFLPQYCASVGGPTWLVYAISASTLINAAIVSALFSSSHLLDMADAGSDYLGSIFSQ